MTDGSPLARKQTMKVIVADDDPIIRSLIISKLLELRCRVTEAVDGADAWAALAKEKFDLAFIDLQMPNIDGLTLIQCIRGHPRTKHMPIIVLTSRKDSQAVSEAFEAGATSFLVKPLQWSTFSSHVEYLMRLNQEASDARSMMQQAVAACQLRGALMSKAISASSEAAERISLEARDLLESIHGPVTPEQAERRLNNVIEEACNINSQLTDVHRKINELSSLLTINESYTPLKSILTKTLESAKGIAEERSITVTSTTSCNNLLVAGDGSAIVTVIQELLQNAISASPDGARVQMETVKQPDCMVTISVSDDGAGMEPEQIAEFLSPSIQCEKNVGTRDNNWGGVGIPLAKAIAEAHSGALEIRSMPGSGTTAMLVIPSDRVLTENEEAA